MTITRFPPSPTGDLHIGGVRTALYSWAFAQQNDGEFILRIEDTDRERSTDEAVAVILEGMQWLGLNYDQGPFYQTKRFKRYATIIEQLLKQGDAYYCTCTKERLDEIRTQQRANKQKPKYDGHCRSLAYKNSDNAVVRFKNPTDGSVLIDDLVKGKISINNQELDDLVIARSDNTPTYNLTVVVDDMDMKISHVIRGDDHINNTPRQINIFKALGVTTPKYAHVPMILGADGKRLSKRHGALSLLHYRDAGYLPEALLNYLVRLGWSHGEQEIFSVAEIVKLFTLDAINVAPSTFNPEKLLWVNQQHIMNADPADLTDTLQWFFNKLAIDTTDGADLTAVIKLQQPRAKTLLEMAENSRYFYQDFERYDDKAAKKAFKDITPLRALLTAYQSLTDWSKTPIHDIIKTVTDQLDTKMGKVAQPLRVAVTGGGASPSIDDTLVLIGKEKTLIRLEKAIQFMENNNGKNGNDL